MFLFIYQSFYFSLSEILNVFFSYCGVCSCLSVYRNLCLILCLFYVFQVLFQCVAFVFNHILLENIYFSFMAFDFPILPKK